MQASNFRPISVKFHSRDTEMYISAMLDAKNPAKTIIFGAV
jgi:hypothetical protein